MLQTKNILNFSGTLEKCFIPMHNVTAYVKLSFAIQLLLLVYNSFSS